MRVYLQNVGVPGYVRDYLLAQSNGWTVHDGLRYERTVSGQVYVEIDDHTGELPAKFDYKDVAQYSFMQYIDASNIVREAGEYDFRSASAYLEPKARNNTSQELRITGADLADVRQLYILIRRGEILPRNSWAKPQITKLSLWRRLKTWFGGFVPKIA